MKNLKLVTFIIFVFTVISLVLFSFTERFLEPKIVDMYTKLFSVKKASDDVVIVMIDQKSINEKRWPWKRELYADMSKFVRKYGQAKVIVFDMLLQSPDEKNSDEKFYLEMSQCDNCVGAFATERDLPNESKMSPTELKVLFEKSKINLRRVNSRHESNYSDVLKITSGYLNNVKIFGYVNTPVDADGVVRNAHPILKIKDGYHPMLA